MAMKNMYVFAIFFYFFSLAVGAEELDLQCQNLNPRLKLQLVKCYWDKNVLVGRYGGTEVLPLYATDFDDRQVVIAQAKKMKKILEFSFNDVNGNQILLAPPFEEQILNREKGKSAYKKWTLYQEIVQYKAQGGEGGYVMQCTTATQQKNKGAIAVSECFSLENRIAFFSLLDAIQDN
jgi:hypothetical protein